LLFRMDIDDPSADLKLEITGERGTSS